MSTLVQILNSFNTSQTPRGQELLGHIKEEWQIKMIAVFFFITHEIKRVLFHAQPQTGANSSFHLKASAEMFLQSAFQNKLHSHLYQYILIVQIYSIDAVKIIQWHTTV